MKQIRKSVICTSNILNTIYTLCNQDGKKKLGSKDYIGRTIKSNRVDTNVGLITKNGECCFLSVEEIYIYDILLSWYILTNDNDDKNIDISFNDIDWIKSKQRRNKDYIMNNHKKYSKVLESLKDKMFICNDRIYPLIVYVYKDENNYEKGLTYNLGHIGNILKQQNQLVELDTNAFKFSNQEFMKYQLLRYMVTAIYMNQVKKKSFTRTHKSILNAIVYGADGNNYKYYDFLIENKNYKTYLNRYYKRLDEVLMLLKECGYIRDYSIIPDNNLRSLITSCGRVEICTNVYKIKEKRMYKYVKK